jgi:hypothetical protein
MLITIIDHGSPLYNTDPYVLKHDPCMLRCQCILQYTTLILSIIIAATATIVQLVYIKEAYHTFALSGQAWVVDFLSGHPWWIWTELGVTHEVSHRRASRYGLSQLAICVTGGTACNISVCIGYRLNNLAHR